MDIKSKSLNYRLALPLKIKMWEQQAGAKNSQVKPCTIIFWVGATFFRRTSKTKGDVKC